jgi:hypothetical protein
LPQPEPLRQHPVPDEGEVGPAPGDNVEDVDSDEEEFRAWQAAEADHYWRLYRNPMFDDVAGYYEEMARLAAQEGAGSSTDALPTALPRAAPPLRSSPLAKAPPPVPPFPDVHAPVWLDLPGLRHDAESIGSAESHLGRAASVNVGSQTDFGIAFPPKAPPAMPPPPPPVPPPPPAVWCTAYGDVYHAHGRCHGTRGARTEVRARRPCRYCFPNQPPGAPP